jgi:hypothetical protein
MTLLSTGERGNGGAEEGGFHDVVVAADSCRAVPLADPQLHRGDYRALRAKPLDVAFQLPPGVAPGLADQVGPAGDLGVAGVPARLPISLWVGMGLFLI